MTRLWVALAILALAALLLLGLRSTAKAEPVSAAVVMLLDYSSSMVRSEREWQRDGLATVLSDQSIEDRIAVSRHGAVAVCVVRFSNLSSVVIPWTILRPGDGSVPAFRAAVAALPLGGGGGGGTDIAQALLYARALLEEWADAPRLVVDLQSDGVQGEAPTSAPAILTVEAARDALGAQGIIINALIMGTQQTNTDLASYYYAHVASGVVWTATDLEAYLKALQVKIFQELGLYSTQPHVRPV